MRSLLILVIIQLDVSVSGQMMLLESVWRPPSPGHMSRCHAVSHSHVTEITLFITSLVTLGLAAVNCYDRTWGALQPLHYPSPSFLCSPWVCLIQCFGPQWLSIPVMFTFCVRHLYARLMSVTLLLSSHNREE